MGYNFVTNIQGCIESATAMMHGNLNLIYYTHIPALIISIIIGTLFIVKSRKLLSSKIIIALSIILTVWILADLVAWVSSNSTSIMFFWSLQEMLDSMMFLAGLYLLYTYNTSQDLKLWMKTTLGVLFLPIVVMIPWNISSFDYGYCTVIDSSFINYVTFFTLLMIILTIITAIYRYKTTEKKDREQIILISIGIALFLISILFSEYISDMFEIYAWYAYGVFAMTLFLAFLSFIIVRFKAFNIKLLGTQALVWALVILIGSQFLYLNQTPTSLLVIMGVTLIISAVAGLLIVRSVKKEIAQKEQIEKLAVDLEKTNFNLENANSNLGIANEKLKELDELKTEFVSLTTHQIRGPITALKGYASMILEGDFGKITAKIKEPVGIIYESSRSLEKIVEDFLNISRIEQGRMQYDFQKIDFGALVKSVVDELRPTIEKTKLAFSFDILGDNFMINADKDKIKQVVLNFIDNSLKYTPSGSVKVLVENKISGGKKLVRFSVKDTGVGISKETLPKLFEKFSRAKDANKTNIRGTGLGLYVAKKMVEAHNGKLWAESDGEGKGSSFIVEIAVV